MSPVQEHNEATTLEGREDGYRFQKQAARKHSRVQDRDQQQLDPIAEPEASPEPMKWTPLSPQLTDEPETSNSGWGDDKPSVTLRDGDWACTQCGVVNFRGRDSCYRKNCGAPRSGIEGDIEATQEKANVSSSSKWRDLSEAPKENNNSSNQRSLAPDPAQTSRKQSYSASAFLRPSLNIFSFLL